MAAFFSKAKENWEFVLVMGLFLFVSWGYNGFHETPIIMDAAWYNNVATNLTQKNVFFEDPNYNRTLEVVPGYPVFLSLIYKTIGVHPEFIPFIHSLLFLGTGILMLFFFKELGISRTFRIVGLAVYFFYPPFIQYCDLLLSEIFYIFLTSILLWYQVAHQPQWTLPKSFFLGIGFSLAMLTRLNAIGYPLFYGICMVFIFLKWDKSRIKEGLKALLLFGLGVSILVGIWTWRNYTLGGRIIPIAAYGGRIVWAGNSELTKGVINKETKRKYREMRNQRIQKGKGTVENDFYFYKKSVLDMAAHPSILAQGIIRKIQRLWFNWDVSEGWPSFRKLMIILGNSFFLVFGIFGIFKLNADQKKAFFPIFIFMGYTILFHLVTYSLRRYSLPIMPYFILFSIFYLSAIIKKQKT